MNKRQRKKKQKKYLPIIADEFNLLTMSEEESKKAHKEFLKYRERFAYRKRYKDLEKDLKEKKRLAYVYPVGEKLANSIKAASNLARGPRKTVVVTQSLHFR